MTLVGSPSTLNSAPHPVGLRLGLEVRRQVFLDVYRASWWQEQERAHLTSFIFESAVSIFTGGFIVDSVAKSIGKAKEYSGSSPPSLFKRLESESKHQDLVDHFNSHISHAELRATHLVPSHIHPEDGFAFRMNVHTEDDTVLHAHTNGTHMMTLFHEGTYLEMRANLPTQDTWFKFSGVGGIKMQAHIVNHPNDSQ